MSANIDNGVLIGALGSSYVGTTAVQLPPKGMVIVAIQFITENEPSELIAEEPKRFFHTGGAANGNETANDATAVDGAAPDSTQGVGGDNVAVDAVKFPAGMTIYGRWTSVTLEGDDTGGAIIYFGY